MAHLVNLRIAHGPKSHPASFEDLGKVSMPAQTRSYVPIRHDDLVLAVKKQLEASDLQVVQESHVLWRNGSRLFSLMQVQHPSFTLPDAAMVVGLRNSTDKSLPASILASQQIFLCDNLSMAAELILGRRHTTFILDDLPSMIESAMAVLFKSWQKHINRMEVYRNFDLCDSQAHDLIARSFMLGAIGKQQVAEVIEQYHNPNHPEFKDRNLYSLQNSFTEIWKGRLDLLPTNSKLLHSLLDETAEFNG